MRRAAYRYQFLTGIEIHFDLVKISAFRTLDSADFAIPGHSRLISFKQQFTPSVENAELMGLLLLAFCSINQQHCSIAKNVLGQP